MTDYAENKRMLKQIIDSLYLDVKETEYKVAKMKRQLEVFKILDELPDIELAELIKGIQNWSK